MQFSDGSMPIPGENYTSDTKNYPWHQPPEFKNITEALDKMSVKFTDPKTARYLMAFAEGGFPLVRIAQMIVMEGVSQGKWTVDMGLLLAGPFTKIFEIMCDSYDIQYDIGITDKDEWNTGNYYKAMTTLKKEGGTVPDVSQVVEQQLGQIESAAEAQDPQASPDSGAQDQTASTDDSNASGGGDLAMDGFASIPTPAAKGKK